MPNPLENKMLLYYINALGSGLMEKDDPMQAVAGVTQQQMATQNYMNLIKQMLAGGDAKFSTDGKKFKLDGPSALLGDVSELSKEQKVPFAGAPSGTAMNVPGGQLGTSQDLLRQMFLNPSASPLDISGADLIGLTPENISQALQLRFMGEALERKKLSDLRAMMVPTPAAPIETPGIGKLSLKQWSSLPTDDRSYYLYVASAKQRDEEAMNKEDWMASTDTNTRIQYLKALEKDEDLKSLAIELEQAGRDVISIGEQVIQKGRSKDIVRVTSSTYAQETRDDIAKDPERKLEAPYIKKYMEAGMKYEGAQLRAHNAVLYDAMYKGLQIAYKKIGKEVTWGKTGWEVDGVEVQGYP